jgi:hypothetical protein
MEPNPYQSPSEAVVRPKRRYSLYGVLIVLVVVWFSLPLIVIGGIYLLALSGGQFGD